MCLRGRRGKRHLAALRSPGSLERQSVAVPERAQSPMGSGAEWRAPAKGAREGRRAGLEQVYRNQTGQRFEGLEPCRFLTVVSLSCVVALRIALGPIRKRRDPPRGNSSRRIRRSVSSRGSAVRFTRSRRARLMRLCRYAAVRCTPWAATIGAVVDKRCRPVDAVGDLVRFARRAAHPPAGARARPAELRRGS